ncbi:adenylate/guanylate cyclase domain-containing protein [candidate division KSB1 bacterium]|nr:adenylate/guanylate cyclase domain-containing protein [candidate division KSB1 bacterium]
MKSFIKSVKGLAVLITFAAFVLAMLVSSFTLVQNMHLKIVDTFFSLRGPLVPSDSSIVVITIDDEALKSLPSKYPFPTLYYSRLVNNLDRAGARLIIFDIEFTEANSLNPESDLEFARRIREAGNVILAGKVVFDVGSYGIQNFHLLEPIAPLLRSGAGWGLVNTIEDADGFIRQYLLFHQVNEKTYYPLAVKALEHLQGRSIPAQDPYLRQFRTGLFTVPKASANSFFINYRGPVRTFPVYSLAHVLDDSTFDLLEDDDTDIFDLHLEWDTFRDKIVLIGASAEELQDNKYTPFYHHNDIKRKMPGVEMHAHALSTLLDRDFLRMVPRSISISAWLFLAILTAFVTLLLRPFKALAVMVCVSLFLLFGAFFLFSEIGWIVNLTQPLLVVVLIFFFNTLYQIVQEQKEKNRIRQTFQQYVAPSIVNKMLSTGELPAYGGERRELTMLFSDIRKFSSFSENHEPEYVVNRLSEYLSAMVEIIFKHNGTLDKFIGDEIMALFGAPYSFADHAERACIAALEMVKKLEFLKKEKNDGGNSLFQIGIGINTGKVIVGNLGSSQLFDYTVIGDHVNIGARLEGVNKEYKTTIILSEHTWDAVRKSAIVRELDMVRVMGRNKPLRIYELLGMESVSQMQKDYLIDLFGEGLSAYRDRRWSDAIKIFHRILRYYPADGPARVFTIRCLNYLEKAPSEEWDGVFELQQK